MIGIDGLDNADPGRADGAGSGAQLLLPSLRALRDAATRALFPDYNRVAIAFWCALVAAGAAALVVSAAKLAALPLERVGQVLLIAGIAAAVGLFPLRLPRSRNSLAAGDVFIFLVLLLHGPYAAALAAASEAAVAAWRTSKRWSSRLVGPAAATLAMLACGHAYELVRAALERAGAGDDPAVYASVVLFAALYFLISPTLVTAVFYLKRERAPTWREWLDSFGWLGVGYLASALVAGILYLAFRQFGLSAVLIAAPMSALFLAALHHYFALQESAEREIAERAARDRAEAAERLAAQTADHLRALEASDRRFEAAFDHAAIGMALLSPDGRVLQCNRAMSALLGRSEAEILGAAFAHFTNSFDAAALGRELRQLRADDGEGVQIELRLRRPDGREAWASLHGGVFPQADTADGCLILQAVDVTARRLAEARLQHMAYHDGLTNLANRSRLHEALVEAIEAHRADPARQFGVLYVAFDRYRLLNDSLGLGAGDQFLVRVGRRLKQEVRPGDLAARVSGDEFAILVRCESRGSHAVVALAEQLQRAFAEPMQIDGSEVMAGASIGVTFCDVGYLTPEEALRDAGLARQKACSSGSAQPGIFDPNLHERARDKLLIEAALRRAIAANQLSLAFQPIYDLGGCGVVGFEALARWEHPERGAVAPSTFVQVAEESGLIGALTQWAIRRACQTLRGWLDRVPGAHGLFVNVNISGHDLCDPKFADFVQDVLREHGLPAAQLTLEITENTLMQQLERGSNTLARLREIGVGLSVDDFGTGYSSLSYLSTLPISSLKIDRSFVSRLDVRADDAEIVRTVIQLGDALGKRVVAEGIESAAQLERLRRFGCELGQGYYFARPLTPQLALALLTGGGAVDAPARTEELPCPQPATV